MSVHDHQTEEARKKRREAAKKRAEKRAVRSPSEQIALVRKRPGYSLSEQIRLLIQDNRAYQAWDILDVISRTPTHSQVWQAKRLLNKYREHFRP